MGCAASNKTRVIAVKSVTPDEPECLRVKLSSKCDDVNAALVKKQICEALQIFSNRITVEATKQKEFYLVTVNTLPGDEPGTVQATMKKLVSTILKECIPIVDKCKIISSKVYETMGEDD